MKANLKLDITIKLDQQQLRMMETILEHIGKNTMQTTIEQCLKRQDEKERQTNERIKKDLLG